jgi:hypothetical protein
MEKKKPRMLTAKKFAQEMKVSYTTVMAWLDLDIIPDAEKTQDERGVFWQIPETSLHMERPRRGRKPKSSKNAGGNQVPGKNVPKKARKQRAGS